MHDLAIVIPAYKESFLNETLSSIALQTDKRFTLYIGDDCSPYNIKRIVDKYTNKVRIVYHRFDNNLGGSDLVAQWERCIELTANEEYIWLFSDDDVMEPRCVERFYEIIDNKPKSELLHFDIQMIDEFNSSQIVSLPLFPCCLSAGDYLKKKLSGEIVSFVVEFIFSRTLHQKVHGFQKFDLAWGSDFVTWLKMAANTKNGIITIKGTDCKVSWRKSTENISPKKSREIQMRKIYALIENARFIKNELMINPSKYLPLRYSFRWWRFPLGEIWRNKQILSFKDKVMLCYKYFRTIY